MSLPTIIADYNASLGDAYKGQPVVPKDVAEIRLANLQAELAQLDPNAENHEEKLQVYNREIQEAQTILDNQTYTEDEEAILYWRTYNDGLRAAIQQFILSQQPE